MPNPETPQENSTGVVENKDPISTEVRSKLEEAKAALSAEVPADNSGFTQLALTNLAEAMATENRAEVSAKLSALRNDANFPRLSEPLRNRLNTLQTEVETVTEKGVRLTQEGVGAVKDAVGELHPALKTGIYGATILAGSALVMKAFRILKNFFVSAGGAIGNVASSAKRVGGNVLGKLLTGAKVALSIGGLAAMGKVGYDTFVKKEAPEAKTDA